ncbi:MAG: ABC transporter ATP-binding protein [Candidatus Omnitrophota bacterium]|nr:ABC transporter ATP-binding protein [Candidatus Omnitrophota bacterium]MDP3786335.1 ABC transporter ATP-binding protein [Candidatus Omnitrophota bacterium]
MIEIVNLCKAFEDHVVLDNVNLTLQDGETIVVIGRSGTGKSVLLKHIIGILKPDMGQVVIDGEDITRLDENELNVLRLKFGMLFQGAALFDSLNVRDNVAFNLIEHTKTDEKATNKRVAECLEMVGLHGIEDLRISELSGGMKKRVGLARAICMNPKIILYDEPTTGVDPIGADAINELIKELQGKLKTLAVVVTHDMVSAYKVADRIAMLYKGKIIEVGTPEEIKNTRNAVVRQFITGAAAGPITED